MKTETHKIGDKDRVYKVSDSGTTIQRKPRMR